MQKFGRDIAEFDKHPHAEPDLVARAAGQRGVSVVAITDSDFSPLVPLADVWLEVVELESGPLRPLVATFTVALSLAVLSAERRVMLKATLFCPAAICLPWYTSNSLMDSRIWPQAD